MSDLLPTLCPGAEGLNSLIALSRPPLGRQQMVLVKGVDKRLLFRVQITCFGVFKGLTRECLSVMGNGLGESTYFSA